MTTMTVRGVIDSFLAYHAGYYEPRAYSERRRVVNLFAAWLDNKPLAECVPADVLAFVTAHKEWKPPWSMRLVNQGIQRVFNWAAKLRLVKENPFKGVTFPEGEPRRAMKTTEFNALIKSTDSTFRPVLWFLWWTGARPGEVASMKWSDVDFERGIVTLKKHKTVKKTRKPRTIPLCDEALKFMQVMRRRIPMDDATLAPLLVFTNRSGRAWNRSSLSLRMQRLRKAIGLPRDCYLYGSRHAYGTNAVLAGVPILMIAKCMGHSGTNTTIKHYVHIDQEYEALRGAANFKRPTPKAA